MARVTVTDCLENVDNRFQLVLVASKRARQINLGAEPMVEPDNDKPSVIALREIAAGYVDRRILDDSVPMSGFDFAAPQEEKSQEELSNELFNSGSAESSEFSPEVEENT